MTDQLSLDDFKTRLETFISEKTGESATITQATPLAGGASRDSWALQVQVGESMQGLVLRRDLPTTMNENALTREQEFRVMSAAYETGVTVAKVRWFCNDPDVLGLPFFLMDYVGGMSIGRKVIRAPQLEHARSVLPEQLAQQLAVIHTIDMDKFGLDFLPTPNESYTPEQHAIAEMYEVLDALEVHSPAFEFALRWAEHNAPRHSETIFLHGDFRIGNLLVDEKGLSAVIDWEFSHIGDPHEELGYICMRDWRFGNDHLHAGGLCERERFILAYEEASQRTIDRTAVDWWEILGNIRWGIICMAQADRHLSGADPSVELVSLGRRSAEMQLEALRLIEKVGV